MRLVAKLMIALAVIVAGVAFFSGVVLYKSEERQLLKMVTLSADQLSRSVTSATWHAMLADRREDAYQVMSTIAEKQGVDRILMFNRDGLVTFSTQAADLGVKVTQQSENCIACHSGNRKLDRVPLESRFRIVEHNGVRRSLAITTPIYNEPSCSQASCHAHPASTKVVGILEIGIHLNTADAALLDTRTRIIERASIEIILICLLVYFFVRRFISNPIQKLIAGTHAISQMELSTPIPIPSNSGEITELASSFDTMRERLRAAVNEINEFTQQLESKVASRTSELEVAHKKLLQSDRLASLGQLAASVAHEINNPIAGVLNLAMLLQRILKDDDVPRERLADIRRYLSQVVQETSRVGRIVSDLLSFSRRSSPHRAEADLNSIVRTTLSLVSHKLKLGNVEIVDNLAAQLPPTLCDRSQVQQVALNLLLNAAEAMQAKNGGRLTLESGATPDTKHVYFRVVDTGEGIPKENLARIFDPFFTTKPEGKGVGLGLAVSYGIIQAHGGDIEVKSEPGAGTAFTVTLPAS